MLLGKLDNSIYSGFVGFSNSNDYKSNENSDELDENIYDKKLYDVPKPDVSENECLGTKAHHGFVGFSNSNATKLGGNFYDVPKTGVLKADETIRSVRWINEPAALTANINSIALKILFK